MFNIGGGEFLVIALIALIVLGPTRLPDAARQVGKAMGELRKLSNGFQSELKSAFDDAETTKAPRRDVLGAGTAVDRNDAETKPQSSGSPSARRREPLRAGDGSNALPTTEATKRTDTASTKAQAATKTAKGTPRRASQATKTAQATKATKTAKATKTTPATRAAKKRS